MAPTNDNRDTVLEEALTRFVDECLQGNQPDVEKFLEQYPQCEAELKARLQDFEQIDSLFDSLVQADESDFVDPTTGEDLVGERIGSFEIAEMIGRGGMGVVYRARDTKLGRSVAVKSIPAQLQASATSQARLKREAKLLASLNHPNIAVIHDIIEEDRSGYLILEYVPGRTLAQRMARKPLSMEEALSIARQIAEAVAAAHENGIVHRDLKPGNIKITPEGKVKVLDFGLAKVSVGEGEDIGNTVTQPGRVMGTPAYMSPEQARGQAMDRRSDIWSFGCILYEMLTGQLPFEGATSTDTLARIIERQPDWAKLPQETPMNIRVLIRRCLEKDPHRRLQHIGDALIEIQETLNLPAEVSPQTTLVQADQLPLSRPRLMVPLGVGAIIGGILIGAAVRGLWPSEPIPRAAVRSFSITPKTGLSLEALYHQALALSPDGGLLAYIGQGDDWRTSLHLRDMDRFEARRLSGTERAMSPFFSPDGQWLAYVDNFHRRLKKIPITGGRPVDLASCAEFRGGSWGPDDRIVFTPSRAEGLWQVWASGEGLRELTRPDPNLGEKGHRWPQILPDGEHVLFTCGRKSGSQIEVYSLKTQERQVLFKRSSYARYLPSGHIVHIRYGILHAVAFDLASCKVAGSHVPVISDITISTISGSAQFTFAQDGTIACIPLIDQRRELEATWVTANGITAKLPMDKRNYHSVSVSPDGAYVAFRVLMGREWNGELWIYDVQRRTATRLATGIGLSTPVWTPDSQELIYNRLDETVNLFRQRIDGTQEPKLIAQFEYYAGPTSCSPDGKVLLATRNDPNRPMLIGDIWTVPLEDGPAAAPAPFIERTNHQAHGVWSPDGHWIAYTSDESGTKEIYVQPYPGPGPKTKVSIDGGLQPVWSRDGTELYYRSGGKMMIAATIETTPQFKVTGHRELVAWHYLDCMVCQTYDVAPDGRFLMIQASKETPPQRINVVLNWFEELKRLVPPGGE